MQKQLQHLKNARKEDFHFSQVIFELVNLHISRREVWSCSHVLRDSSFCLGHLDKEDRFYFCGQFLHIHIGETVVCGCGKIFRTPESRRLRKYGWRNMWSSKMKLLVLRVK